MNIFCMRIIAITFLILNFFFLSNCISTKNYFINRVNDLKDIVHIGVEKDVYGASIFVDSIGLGIQHAANGKGVGIRYGHIGFYKTGGKVLKMRMRIAGNTEVHKFCDYNNFTDCLDKLGNYNTETIRYGNSIILNNTSFHEPMQLTNRNSSKRISLHSMFLFLFIGGNKSVTFIYDTDPKEDSRGDYTILPIEISAGLYLGIRLGFNFSELADFLVGFVGFDPLGDDIEGIPQPILMDIEIDDRKFAFEEIFPEKKIPLIKMGKSKYSIADSFEIAHCKTNTSCYNYELAKHKAIDLEAICKINNGSFGINTKCNHTNIISFCQLSISEKIYNYYHNIWSLESAENDCKLLKGKFVK